MARIFNGTSHYLRVTPAPVTALPMTIAAWVKLEGAVAVGAAVSMSDEASTGNFFSMTTSTSPSNCWKSSTRMGGATFGAVGSAPNNQWQHVVAITVSDVSRTVYVNGGVGVTDTTDAGTFTANYDNLCVAALRRSSGLADYFKGKVHSVAVYSKALSAAEVAQLALGADPSVVAAANLVGNWSDLGRTLVGSVGGTLVDVVGSTTVDNDTPFGVNERRPVYALSDVTGLQKWVDYIPVAVPTTYDAADIDRHSDAGVRRTVGLSSVTGLRAWVDYTPVYVVTATAGKQWRTDDTGWIPVTHV